MLATRLQSNSSLSTNGILAASGADSDGQNQHHVIALMIVPLTTLGLRGNFHCKNSAEWFPSDGQWNVWNFLVKAGRQHDRYGHAWARGVLSCAALNQSYLPWSTTLLILWFIACPAVTASQERPPIHGNRVIGLTIMDSCQAEVAIHPPNQVSVFQQTSRRRRQDVERRSHLLNESRVDSKPHSS